MIAAAKASLGLMFARPATPSYPELSAILQKNIQQVLLGQATPEDAHGGGGEGGGQAALTLRLGDRQGERKPAWRHRARTAQQDCCSRPWS